MLQHDDPAEHIAPEFLLKPRRRIVTHIQRNVVQRHALRLIQLFEAIDQRAALHRHAEGVSLTAFALPLTSLALHRDQPSRALGPLALIAVIFGARLRGTPGAALPGSPKAWWYRFWLDRDTKE